MTQHKHLKQRVRDRMRKTGESYATARRQVVARRPAGVGQSPALPPAGKRSPTKAAGMSGEALRKRTGRDWDEWLALLDRAGAMGLDHRGIVARLVEAGVGAWWCQMIAVGYEQARGKRVVNQRCDGSFQASVSKTLDAPLGEAWAAWTGPGRDSWLAPDGPITVRKATPPRAVAKLTTPAASLRWTWSDGGLVLVYFYRKADGRCSVAVQIEKLPDAAAVAAAKASWKARLERLSRRLTA